MFEQGGSMKKRFLTVLIVLTEILFFSTSIVCACPGGHRRPGLPYIDSPDVDTRSMKIQIVGPAESSMNIKVMDLTKLKNDQEKNPRGYRRLLDITMNDGGIKTVICIYHDDSKEPDIYTWYLEQRRIRRPSKTDFENKEYEDTTLTLKELMDAAVKLTDRDQVTIKDKTVFVLERGIEFK